MQTSSESSTVRINRLKDGYSWGVTVVADDSSPEALRVAKERALELNRELEAELAVVNPDEVFPFED